MKPYKIIVGEDVDLPEKIIKDNNIGIFNYSITLGDKTFKKDQLYRQMRENKKQGIAEYPKTSQPSVGYFSEMLKKALNEYEKVILMTISSEISGTYNSASQAVTSLSPSDKKRIVLIDSRNGSVSEALITLALIELFDSKTNVSDLEKKIQNIISRVRLILTIDDPEWLEAGGRISKVKAIIIKQMMKLSVRPILSVKEGKVELLKIKTNVKEKADALFNQFEDEIGHISDKKQIQVVISHGDNKSEALKLTKKIHAYNKDIKVKFESCCSAVFGAHLGPDCLLMGWIVN
jgi:DegV family protein with EDD domain